MRLIPLVCRSPLVKHVVSLRRQVSMLLKDNREELNLVLYFHRVTRDCFKCFECGEEVTLFDHAHTEPREAEAGREVHTLGMTDIPRIHTHTHTLDNNPQDNCTVEDTHTGEQYTQTGAHESTDWGRRWRILGLEDRKPLRLSSQRLQGRFCLESWLSKWGTREEEGVIDEDPVRVGKRKNADL